MISKQASEEKAQVRDHERKVSATNRVASLGKVRVSTEEIDIELSKIDRDKGREALWLK